MATQFEKCVVALLKRIMHLLEGILRCRHAYERHLAVKLSVPVAGVEYDCPFTIYEAMIYAENGDVQVEFNRPVTDDSWVIKRGAVLAITLKVSKIYLKAVEGEVTVRMLMLG